MEASDFRLTLPTPYGPATYTIRLAPDGRGEVVGIPFAGLPESAGKLTYGKRWAAVRRYFVQLATTLPFRMYVAVRLPVPPVAYAPVADAFARLPPGERGEALPEIASLPGLIDPEEGPFHRGLYQLTQEAGDWTEGPFAGELIAYLDRMLPLSGDGGSRLIYQALGTLCRPEGREVLLAALESDGRHPYTETILDALRHYPAADTWQRVRGVYRAGKIGEADLESYLAFLMSFRDRDLVDHLEDVLAEHPAHVSTIMLAMRSNGARRHEIAARVHRRFYEEADYHALDELLRAVNGARVPEFHIDLAAMNARVAVPAFVDVPQVNWPQQLEAAWARLVHQTALPEALSVINEYLQRPEPRLQRNALLQLKTLLQAHTLDDPLPPPMEDRLRALVKSRYDKVYVEVLNVLGRRNLPLNDPRRMLDAVLEVSVGSRYRFVVLTALRSIGNRPDLRERARLWLTDEITAADAARLETIGAWLPFAEKYLGDTADLRELLQRRNRQRSD